MKNRAAIIPIEHHELNYQQLAPAIFLYPEITKKFGFGRKRAKVAIANFTRAGLVVHDITLYITGLYQSLHIILLRH